MKTLAFDTSTKILTIACLEDEKVKTVFHKDVGLSHSELLVPEIRRLTQDIGWDIKDIGLVCVGLGPGSFTGLRIAVSAVKGLAAVLKCKITGVPTMDAMAVNAIGENGLIAPFLDARKDKIYVCVYRITNGCVARVSDYLLEDAEYFLEGLKEKVLFFGDGVEKYKDKLDICPLARYDISMDWYPRAEHIGQIGLKMGTFIEAEDLEPLYLHPKECNVTKQTTDNRQQTTDRE